MALRKWIDLSITVTLSEFTLPQFESFNTGTCGWHQFIALPSIKVHFWPHQRQMAKVQVVSLCALSLVSCDWTHSFSCQSISHKEEVSLQAFLIDCRYSGGFTTATYSMKNTDSPNAIYLYWFFISPLGNSGQIRVVVPCTNRVWWQ